MIAWVLLFASIALTVHILVSYYRRLHKIIDLIPGPKPGFLFGNISMFQVSEEKIWIQLRKLADTYYPIYRIWIGTIPMVNIRHPDDIEIILGNSNFNTKSKIYTFLTSYFGTGLFTSSGAKWQKRRKMLSSVFHFNILQQYVNIFVAEGDRMIKSLKNEDAPVVKDLMPLISEHVLNMVCETIMSTSLRDKRESQQVYIKAVHELAFIAVYRILRPWLYPNFIAMLVPTGWRQAKLVNVMCGFSKTIISERRAYHDQTGGRYLMGLKKENANGEAKSENDLGIQKSRLSFLDWMIAANRKEEIDEEGINEEINTFMVAGFHTSSLCICFTLMLLAEHKEIQERARAEVNAIWDENDGKMSLSSVQQLTYLERCIKESLRLYPIVHAISRQIEHPVRLSNYEIPKDTMLHIHIADTHRDPNFWPEPEVFDPDRFLPEKVKDRHPYAYIPFSAGSRNCIGQRFSMIEMKTFIGNILRNFYLEPIDYLKDLRLRCDVTIQLENPMRSKFIPIKESTKGTEGA